MSSITTPAQIAQQTLCRTQTRLTPARAAVIAALAEGEHLTAPEVVEAVQIETPTIGRASVYRALELLTRLGVCQVAAMGGPVARYTLAPSGQHHHLICSICQRLVEFDSCGLTALAPEIEARTGFRIHGHLLEAYGICPDCQ